MKKMILSHVALTCSSEDNCDRFYKDILGLNKVRSFVVSSELVLNIFGMEGECRVIDYRNDELAFEIFLVGGVEVERGFNHVCLEVEDRDGLIEKCIEMGFQVVKLPKGSDDIYLFIRDFDGNLFEVKKRKV